MTVSVDMDLARPGIQSIRAANTGDTFTVGIVLSVDSNGVSSYGISATIDSGELGLNGSPASIELRPSGLLTNMTAGVVSENSSNIYTFEAVTFGAGPVNTNILIGTISFRARTPVKDGVDINLGFFNSGVDGAYDNNGNGVSPMFNGGLLMPQGPRVRDFRTPTNTVVVAWPAPSSGFSLQQNTNLNITNWFSVTNPVSVVGSENQVIIAPPVGSRFYRLLNP